MLVKKSNRFSPFSSFQNSILKDYANVFIFKPLYLGLPLRVTINTNTCPGLGQGGIINYMAITSRIINYIAKADGVESYYVFSRVLDTTMAKLKEFIFATLRMIVPRGPAVQKGKERLRNEERRMR